MFAGFIFPKYLPMGGGEVTLKLHESHILASTLVSATCMPIDIKQTKMHNIIVLVPRSNVMVTILSSKSIRDLIQ